MGKNNLSGAAFLLIIILFMLQGCSSGKKAEAEENPAMVRVTVAENVAYQKKINTSGRLSHFAELKLSFKTGGVIDNILVKEGHYVKKGDTLAVLALAEIRSQLRRAELLFEKALRDHERINNLYADTAATLEQFQNAKTALEIAESAKEAALFNFNHSVIIAPSNGQVLKMLVENREVIAPGYPALHFASSRDHWLLKVAITDRDIVSIMEGDRADVEFDAYPGKIFNAHVAEIAGMADPLTGTFEVSLALDPGNKRLITGFIGKATIHTSNTDTLIQIPPLALVDARRSEGFVYKYENSKAVKVNVGIREMTDTSFLVTGDLAEGDSIIVEGSGDVKNGQKVLVANP
jgi:membrane fusion protein, multidrug efflux system